MMAKATKAGGSGLAARMPARPVDPVEAGLAAATGATVTPAEVEMTADASGKSPIAAINLRFPRELHRTLRRIAFDEETSINAIAIEALNMWLAARK